jgi:hypothetical protein
MRLDHALARLGQRIGIAGQLLHPNCQNAIEFLMSKLSNIALLVGRS